MEICSRGAPDVLQHDPVFHRTTLLPMPRSPRAAAA